MALAMFKAAPLRPEIKLSQTLNDYEAVLTEDQKASFHHASPLEPYDAMALTIEINRQNAGRKSRVWGARLTTFLNSVKGFTAVVDAVIGNTGDPIAGAVWGAVKTAMQTASCFDSYFDALSNMLMSVGQSAPRYEKYALLYPASTSLRQELCNYFTTVINLCKATVLFVRKPFISQALIALRKSFDEEFGKFRKDLERFGDAVRDEVSLVAKQQQGFDSIEGARERRENSLFRRTGALFRQETAYQLQENKEWRELRVESRFLNSCSAYNYEAALNQARRKGRSTWLFEADDYKQWKSSTSSSVLLCSGIVGSGKTVLSSSVVEEIVVTRTADVSVGYFFCRGDEQESLKARTIMGSLARQLLSSISAKYFGKVDQDVDGITLNIDQIRLHLLNLLPPNGQYIFIVDGLDECEAVEVYDLIWRLQSLLKSRERTFKLFWTGRSDFVAKVSHQLFSHFHVTISQSNNGPEISEFIELALDEALENGRLQLRNYRIIIEIQDALEKQACEMFLWVAFQIESLCHENTDDGILSALKKLPKDLPTTYRRILRRLQDSESADPCLGRKIFELVAAARRPLKLEELREAISIEPDNTTWSTAKLVNDVIRSLNSCGSLVVVDEEFSTVHFAHSSVKQFLETRPGAADDWEYHVNLHHADELYGKILVTYLNLDVLQKQLTRVKPNFVKSATQDALLILRASVPSTTIANQLARRLLKDRRIPGYDLGRDLEKVAGATRDPEVDSQPVHSLFSYAQKHWLSHTDSFETLRESRSYRLWVRLLEGRIQSVNLPWTSQDAQSLNSVFLSSVAQSSNWALIQYSLRKLIKQGAGGVKGVQTLLELLPSTESRSFERRITFTETLRYAVDEKSVAVVRLLLMKTPAEVNTVDGLFGTVLHTALLRGNLDIVQILLDHDADVNAGGGLHGSVLETAASCPIHKQALLLLLSAGAKRIPIDGVNSEEAKKRLQESYFLDERNRMLEARPIRPNGAGCIDCDAQTVKNGTKSNATSEDTGAT